MLLVASAIAVTIVVAAAWLWTPDRSRASLEASYLASPRDYVEVAGIRLHVRDSGGGSAKPAIILLHGMGSSLHTWEPWATDLADRYRVISYDLPGFGLTGVDPTGVYTEARGGEILAALMDRLGIERATLIGNSMGGRLAWNFAVRFPARTAKLVLISPDGFASRGFEYGKPPAVPGVLRAMQYVLPKAVLRSSLRSAYADPARMSEAVVTRYHDMLLAPGVRSAMLARMGQSILVPPEPMLATITAPTLLLWGAEDQMIPVSNAADYQRAMPHAELVVLPGLGHVPHEEAPAVSLASVAAFLAR